MGSSNSRVAALENAGNMARFSADNAKSIIAVGDDRSPLWLVHKGQDTEGLLLD